MTLKEKFWAWYNKRISAGFYKGWSYILDAASVLIAFGPDAVDILLDNWGVVDAIPMMDVETKAQFLLITKLLNLFVLKPLQQRNTRLATLKQAAAAGQVTSAPDTEAVTIVVPGAPPEIVKAGSQGVPA